ncbi:MAG: ankyrin repeat domain-containing protein [Bacteroidota bacterium]
MGPRIQENVSFVLLVSLVLQSCGVYVPRELENKQVSGEELTNPVIQNRATAFEPVEVHEAQAAKMEAIFEGVLAVARQEQTGLQGEGTAGTARSYLLSLQEEGDKAASQLLEPTSKRPRLDIDTSSEGKPDTAINIPPKALVSAMKKWLKGTTLEEKLNPAKPCETTPMQDFIFKAVRAAWIDGTRVGESLQRPRESILSEVQIQDINQDEEEQEEREIAFFHQFIELLDRYDYDEVEIFDLEIDLQALCRKHSHYLGSSLLSRKYAWADEQYTPLQFAARQGNLHMVKELCSEKYKEYKREDVEIEKCEKEMALHCAAAGGHVPTIVYLIEKQQVDVNARDEEGSSVLHYATYGKHLSAVNCLLSYPKMDINVSDRNGLSVLHIAAYTQSVEMVRLFLSKMQLKLINSADEDGKQAVDYAGPETKHMFTLSLGTPIHISGKRYKETKRR